jgi:hypothetical protein
VADPVVPGWKFLTNHAHVLVCIANDPGIRISEIGHQVGITERAAHRIVSELGAAGYITHQRIGRRNQYAINSDLQVHDPVAREQSVGRLLAILVRPERRATPRDPVARGSAQDPLL